MSGTRSQAKRSGPSTARQPPDPSSRPSRRRLRQASLATGTEARTDGYEIRRAAVARGIPCITTLTGGMAATRAIAANRIAGGPPVISLQELHRNGTATPA